MPAFLPRLAKSLLGKPLVLPNAATWWCGGERERAHVLANIDKLVISSAFRRPVAGLPDGHTRAGASLSSVQRAEIERGLTLRPMDYTAQEIVSLSTTPVLARDRFEPRGFTMRAFLARDETGQWVVLQGGFARVSEKGSLRTSLMGMGDISTDVCIVDAAAPKVQPEVLKPTRLEISRDQGLLASQAADNLFWMGRYGERAHQTVRIIRALAEQAITSGPMPAPSSTVDRLANLLRSLGAVPAKSTDWSLSRLAGAALGSSEQGGSVRSLAERERGIAQLLRNWLTRDSWRSIQRTMPRYVPGDLDSITLACDRLVERHAALAWLLSDGMSRGPAWRFLDIGMRLERGSMVLQAAQAIVPGSASATDLAALLDLVDGQSLYRSRYLTMPYIAQVFDMVLLDPAQPRGLAHQVACIEQHLSEIPPLEDDGMPEPPMRLVRQMRARLEALDASVLTSQDLDSLRGDLAALSEAISQRYFLQEDQSPGKTQARLLA
jgi:uncharacterized alpha-E superfamily protein